MSSTRPPPAARHSKEAAMSVTIFPVVKAAGSVLGGLFFADFVSGVVHWFEDRYGNPKWPILGHTIRANQEHHFKPRKFLNGTFIERNREVLVIGALFLLGFWAAGLLNLFTISACLLYTSPSPRDA